MSCRFRATCAAALLLFATLTGCGGDGGGSAERPSLSLSLSPTRTPPPSPTRTPIRTDAPTGEASASETAAPSPTENPAPTEPTEEPTLTEPAEEPTPTRPTSTEPAEEPTGTEPTEEPTGTTAVSPEPSPSEEEVSAVAADDSAESVPGWVWWLLAAIVVTGTVLAAVLAIRGRRRRLWQERLQAAETDVAWVARELLPQLRGTGSLEQVTGGWQVGLPRVTAVEDELTALEASAPDEDMRARAESLRDAVRDARAKVSGLTTTGPHDTWELDLQEAITLLEAALTPTTQPRS